MLIPHAIYLGTALHKDSRDTHLEGVATLLARVNVEGILLVATFTIRRCDHGKWYYSTVVLTEEKEKTRKFPLDGIPVNRFRTRPKRVFAPLNAHPFSASTSIPFGPRSLTELTNQRLKRFMITKASILKPVGTDEGSFTTRFPCENTASLQEHP